MGDGIRLTFYDLPMKLYFDLQNVPQSSTVGDLIRLVQEELESADPVELWQFREPFNANPYVTISDRIMAKGNNYETFANLLRPEDNLSALFSQNSDNSIVHIMVSRCVAPEIESPVEKEGNPYIGEQHVVLYDNINRMVSAAEYSNTVSIIQSSGTGKSRMVDNLATLIFTIPFNIRSEHENHGLAFPPPDTNIARFLTTPMHEHIDRTELFYLNFLRHVFDHVKQELNTQFSHGNHLTHQDLAKSWHNHLECQGVRERIYLSIGDSAAKDWRQLTDGDGDSSKDVEQLAKSAKSALKDLSQAINDCVKQLQSPKVQVLIYFDESHALSGRVVSNRVGKTLFDYLCSALNRLLALPLFVIFLSTNSHIHQLAPSAAIARSARARSNAGFQAPITEVPFDCSLEIGEGELSLAETATVDFMARFGRPLFWAMLSCAGEDINLVSTRMIELARAKLLCDNRINVGHKDLLKRNGATAVVDVRLMLDYEPGREATRSLEADLVATHMRMAYSVPKSREYIRSGYSSEPLLAEAAAQQMYTFRQFDPDAIQGILMQSMTSGLLDKGERGELVARELLLSAYDRAIERSQGLSLPVVVPTTDSQDLNSTTNTIPFYSAGVSLITFIEELFTSEYANAILEGLPRNVQSRQSCRSAFQNAMLRFTHFGKMADDCGVTTDALWPALIRGMAIIARTGETSVDLILPVLLEDNNICEAAVSGVLIQVKRRRDKGTIVANEIDEKTIGFFPKVKPDAPGALRPYISLVMELGIQKKRNDNAVIPAKVRVSGFNPITQGHAQGSTLSADPVIEPSTPSKVQVLEQGRLFHATDLHPRYSIFAYGCSDSVYKGISQGQRDIYQFLLGSRDFLSEHPRQDIKTLNSVRRMKPFWSVGEPCYHWIKEGPMKNGPQGYNEIDDTLVTGHQTSDKADADDSDMLPQYSTGRTEGKPASMSTSHGGKRTSDRSINSGRYKRGKM